MKVPTRGTAEREAAGCEVANRGAATPKPSTFGWFIVGALLPHAAEHLAIELLVQRYPGTSFAGNTSWLERSEKTMRVRVSVPSMGSPEPVGDALSDAIALLNELLRICQRQTG